MRTTPYRPTFTRPSCLSRGRSPALWLLAWLLVPGLVPALGAQGVDPTDFDVVGEVTGCAAPSLCGDFGDSVASAGDLDGDGVLDLAIGASSVSGANPSTGRVYLFHGPIEPGLTVEQAAATITGLEFGDLVSNARAGDLNADGMSDIVIGSRGPDVDGGILNGQVWVFYSPISGDLTTADADATITGTSFSELGRSVTVGDFNGDGVDDVLAGASQSLGGAAHLFYGPIFGELVSADADAVVSGSVAFGEVGESVAAVDLNADGIDDVVVGAPGFPIGNLVTGSVHVFYSPIFGEHQSIAADVTIVGEDLNDEFGSAAASGGDVDGDGFEDLLVGAWQLFIEGAPGKAYLFSGPLPPGSFEASAADAVLLGEPGGGADDLFGILAGAGDVNGDGFDDVVVGAQFGGPASRGRAYIFEGPLSGERSGSGAEWIFDAPGFDPAQGLDALGRAVGAAGDLDGDGFADVLLGAPGSDGPGFARVVTSPGLGVEATPDGAVVLPATGGTVSFDLTVTNGSTALRRVEIRIEVVADAGADRTVGPIDLTLEPTSELSRELSFEVPAAAPAGGYTVTVALGRAPHTVVSDQFTFSKQEG